jgi:fumarylpyruvate hydrolase
MGGDERHPPFFFQKPRDAIVLDGAEVPYPPVTTDFHHEVELVLAIGQSGVEIPVERAAAHIFGIAVGIDLTRRDAQFEARNSGRPWEIGKAFDNSAPIGVLHPISAAELSDARAISLKVNGNIRQRGDVSQMIWAPPEIVGRLSCQYRLEPGDLIYTGTPSGVGPLAVGDIVEASIQGLTPLSITVVDR